MDLEKLKYPTGNFKFVTDFTDKEINSWIDEIEFLPEKLAIAAKGLDDDELGWKYRPEGWNIRQVVHHIADSHMNAFCRFKLTLTEDSPEVKGYYENLWAELTDTTNAPIEWSLSIISGLHMRWVALLRGLSGEDLLRSYHHLEYNKTFELRQVIALYAWHCRHHLAHIEQAKTSAGGYN